MYEYQIIKFLINYFLLKYDDKIYFLECAHIFNFLKTKMPV